MVWAGWMPSHKAQGCQKWCPTWGTHLVCVTRAGAEWLRGKCATKRTGDYPGWCPGHWDLWLKRWLHRKNMDQGSLKYCLPFPSVPRQRMPAGSRQPAVRVAHRARPGAHRARRTVAREVHGQEEQARLGREAAGDGRRGGRQVGDGEAVPAPEWLAPAVPDAGAPGGHPPGVEPSAGAGEAPGGARRVLARRRGSPSPGRGPPRGAGIRLGGSWPPRRRAVCGLRAPSRRARKRARRKALGAYCRSRHFANEAGRDKERERERERRRGACESLSVGAFRPGRKAGG